MHNFFRKKTIFILMSMLIFGIGISLLIAGIQFYFQQDVHEVIAEKYEAGPPPTGDNVSGFAWSENIGWISFNSSDCDTDGNGVFDDVVDGCPDSSVVFHDYGVNIDHFTGNFSGYAWSSNVGWIYFGPDKDMTTEGYGIVQESDAPVTTDNPRKWGDYDSSIGKILGWAKILNLGDDGWISFSDDDLSDSFIYGISIPNSVSGDLSGWAWNGNNDDTGIGWISMSCENEVCINSSTGKATSTDNNGVPVNCDNNTCNGEPGVECRNQCNVCNNDKTRLCVNASHCSASPCIDNTYGVNAEVDRIPEAQNLTAPNWGADDACNQNLYYPSGTGKALGAQLEWKYVDNAGDIQSAYRIIVERDSDSFEVLNTGKCIAMSGDCRIDPNCTNCSFPLYGSDLDYDTSYKWSVQVWDTNDNHSDVTNYNVASDTHNDDTVNTTFTTYEHEFPEPNFTWFPHSPSVNEEVMFMASSTSVCYSSGATVDLECTGYVWDWEYISGSSISDDSPNPDNSYNASTTIIKFTQAGQPINIELKLIDSIDNEYSCSTSTTADDETKQNLPSWIEAK